MPKPYWRRLSGPAAPPAGSLPINWKLPALMEDGAAIGTITGQTVYYDIPSRVGTGVDYANSVPVGSGSLEAFTIPGLVIGETYHFALTVTVGGVESNLSLEGSGVAA